MTPLGDALRPVHALGEVLDGLERCAHPGDPRRGPLRQRAWNLARILPAGALREASALALQRRFRRLVDAEIPLPGPSTLRPEPQQGAAYWLSSHDALGAVFSVGLRAREDGERPFSTFWPAPEVDTTAERTAAETYRLVARSLEAPPLAPLLGWHRLTPLDPGLPSLGRIEGSSFGAALAMMLISTWSGRPLPQDLAVTGCLDRDGALRLSGDAAHSVAAKAAALVRERPCVRRLLVPPGLAHNAPPSLGGLEIVEIETLDELIAAFGLHGAIVLRPTTLGAWLDAVHEAAWLDHTRAVPPGILRDRLEALDRAYAPLSTFAGHGSAPPWALAQAHVEAQVLLCRHRAYLGDRDGAMRVATDLQWLLDKAGGTHRPQHAVTARLLNALASLLIDLGRTDEATRYAKSARREAEAADDRLEVARILSTLGRIAAHAGDDTGALPHLDAALTAFDEVAPWEGNICRCYRIACLARLLRFDAAASALRAAEADNSAATGMRDGWREANALYLAHERLRLALLSGDEIAAAETEATARLAHAPEGPWPAAVLLSRLLEAALARGDSALAADRLEALRRISRRYPAAIVALHRDRGATAIVASRLAADRPVEPLLMDAALRFLKARAEKGPAARSCAAHTLLEDPHTLDAGSVAALRALLSADVY